MTFDQSLSYLLSLGHETLTIKLGLANTENLLEALGNPQQNFPAVQIAGTNGKGSTAVMLDSICRAAKIRTGLFTSPHLVSITERIKINGEPISEDDFARIATEVRATAEELVSRAELETLPTFFEQVTAIALLAFREAKIELAVLETGLGGRLDSTTTARADVVAITPIAMDHEEYLGQTIEEIAAEKAAIIQPGVTAVIAPQPKEAMRIIRRRCEEVEVTPRIVEHQTDFVRPSGTARSLSCRSLVTFEKMNDVYEDVQLGLRGGHQTDNAAVAIALAEALRKRGLAISWAAIIEGLEKARHPGRLELWDGKPPILFDGAHNPAAAHALRQYLDEFVAQPITMIFGAMRDKRLSEMADILFPKADQLILTQIDNPRAASLEELGAAAPPNFDRSRIRQASSIEAALQSAYSVTVRENLILVTGSLYLVGAAQQMLRATTLGVAHRQAQH